MENRRKFIELVESMRKAQRDYFYYHRGSDLEKSKQLEKQVDEAIKIWRHGKQKQGTLF